MNRQTSGQRSIALLANVSVDSVTIFRRIFSRREHAPANQSTPYQSTTPIDPYQSTTLSDPEPVPERHPDHLVCLRGPCRFYWHLVTMAHAGNSAGYFKAAGLSVPRQHHHVCLRSGEETDFSDDNVYDCNQWDPIDLANEIVRRSRREAYYLDHPEHDPDGERPDLAEALADIAATPEETETAEERE